MPKWLIYAIWSCEALGLLQINIASGSLPAGGQWCPAPPFQICAPPFHVWPPGCCIHPIQYFKNVPPFWFLAPLLLNPGDGPVSHPPTKLACVRYWYYVLWINSPCNFLYWILLRNYLWATVLCKYTVCGISGFRYELWKSGDKLIKFHKFPSFNNIMNSKRNEIVGGKLVPCTVCFWRLGKGFPPPL